MIIVFRFIAFGLVPGIDRNSNRNCPNIQYNCTGDIFVVGMRLGCVLLLNGFPNCYDDRIDSYSLEEIPKQQVSDIKQSN
jgi:hypothetical protein